MALDKDTPIFDNISFSNIAKEIYEKKKQKDIQLEKLIQHLSDYVKNLTDASILVPLIKEYLDIGVKNDEIMVKLSGIIQKLIIANTKGDSGDDNWISADEKKQLLQEAASEIKSLKNEISSN